MPELLLPSLIVLAAVYMGVIIHEAGHALIGKAFGFVVTSVGLGTAGPFLILPMGSTRVYLGRIQPFQGLTFAFLPRPYTDRRRLAAFMVGGIVANGLGMAASLGLALCLPTGRFASFFSMFAGVNAVLAALNLIPIHFRVGGVMLRSDGRFLLEILRTSTPNSPTDAIEYAQGCRPLWRAVGDRLMDRLCTLSAALCWIDLGSSSRAELLMSEAAGIDATHPFVDWLEEVTRTNLALFKGEASEASLALSRAVSCGQVAGAEGLYLLDLLRAILWQHEGRHDEALAEFERLSVDTVSRTCPELGLSALISQLRAACVASDHFAVSARLARYEASRLKFPSNVRDLQVYSALARFATLRGTDAGDDYRRALEAVASIAASWRNSDDREAFIDAQRGLMEEARQALGAESAAPLIEAIESHQAEPNLVVREVMWRRWALRLMLINVVLFVPFVLLALAIKPRGESAILLAVLLALFTCLGVICLIFDFAVGKFLPSLKGLTGAILLAMAIMPWIGELIFFAVTMGTP